MSRLPLLARGPGGPDARIERASATDLMELATDVGPMRVQFGALLRIDPPGADPAAISALLAERAARIPRLRQVLRRVPIGCGRPVWVDAQTFTTADHVRRVALPSGDGEVLLRTATGLVAEPMTFARPLWRAAVLEDPSGSAAGVVIAVHHVLADGIGGLAVLAQLVDDADEAPPESPRPHPARMQLLADATRTRLAATRRAPAALAAIPAAAGSWRTGRLPNAPKTSLARPVSGQVQVAAARIRLLDLHDAAQRLGATVNDAVLAAVGGTVGAVLAERGEQVEQVHISAPVSLRRGSGMQLGNNLATMLVAVPTLGAPAERLRRVAALTRTRKGQARSGPASALVGVFRGMGALGLLRPFIEHQRMIQVFVSNVPGPPMPVSLAGARVVGITPMTTLAGNVTLSFLALSYAGELTVSVSADPAVLPDPDRAAQILHTELARLTAPG